MRGDGNGSSSPYLRQSPDPRRSFNPCFYVTYRKGFAEGGHSPCSDDVGDRTSGAGSSLRPFGETYVLFSNTGNTRGDRLGNRRPPGDESTRLRRIRPMNGAAGRMVQDSKEKTRPRGETGRCVFIIRLACAFTRGRLSRFAILVGDLWRCHITARLL